MGRIERLILTCFTLPALNWTWIACRSSQPKTQTLTGYQSIRLPKVLVMPFLAGLESYGIDRMLETFPQVTE